MHRAAAAAVAVVTAVKTVPRPALQQPLLPAAMQTVTPRRGSGRRSWVRRWSWARMLWRPLPLSLLSKLSACRSVQDGQGREEPEVGERHSVS
jgi:hypothetical protein